MFIGKAQIPICFVLNFFVIAWFDDNTGRVQLLDAYSTNDTIKPIINGSNIFFMKFF